MKNLKYLTIIIYILLSFSQLLAQVKQNPKFIILPKIEIELTTFKSIAYGSFIRDLESKRQPLGSLEQSFNFIDNLSSNIEDTEKEKLKSANLIDGSGSNLFVSYSKDEDKALVVLSHPIDLKKFSQLENTATKRSELKDFIGKLKEEKKSLNDAEKNIKILKTQQLTTLNTNNTLANASTYNQLQTQYTSIINQIDNIDKLISEKTKDYYQLFNLYEESNDVVKFVYHKSKRVPIAGGVTEFINESYLTEIKDILIICIGGEKDLLKLSVETILGTTSFESSINGAKSVLTESFKNELPLAAFGLSDQDSETLEDPKVTVPITFIRKIGNDPLRSPYKININIPDQKDPISYDIHELNRFLITFGFAMKYVDPIALKKTATTSNNTLEVDRQSFNIDGIKADAYLMLDIALGRNGRDLDRLATRDRLASDRWGLTFGLRIAKDPLRSGVLGLSYAFNSNVRLIFGVTGESLIKEGIVDVDSTILDATNLNAVIDYLNKYNDREYKIRGFFGLSLNPSNFGKLFK